MTENDESLEIGMTCGLDIPSAMVISEMEDKPPREPKNKSKARYAVAVVAVLIAMVLHLLL